MANENIVNGVDVEQLVGTVNLIQGQPDLDILRNPVEVIISLAR